MTIDFQLVSDMLILGGVVLFVGIVFQVLVGKRVIKFQGKTHMKVHRVVGYLLVAGAAAHGSLAIISRVG